jgi:hypothetical protein
MHVNHERAPIDKTFSLPSQDPARNTGPNVVPGSVAVRNRGCGILTVSRWCRDGVEMVSSRPLRDPLLEMGR